MHNHLTGVQPEQTVGDPNHLGAVSNHNQRFAALSGQSVQQPKHPLPGLKIKVAGWFIRKQQQRVVDQGRAMATRCCSPPDRRSGKLRARSARPTASSRPRARSRAGGPVRPLSSSGRSRFSSTDRVGIRLKNWKIKPIWTRRNKVRSRSLRRVRFTSPGRWKRRPHRWSAGRYRSAY